LLTEVEAHPAAAARVTRTAAARAAFDVVRMFIGSPCFDVRFARSARTRQLWDGFHDQSDLLSLTLAQHFKKRSCVHALDQFF
jgi:hypothetical protein